MDFKRVSSLRFVLQCLTVFAFLSVLPLVYGQGRRNPSPATPIPVPNQVETPELPSIVPPGASSLDIDRIRVVTDDGGKPIATSEYACFRPPLNSISPAKIGVVDLQAPSKSQDEYQSACQSLQKNKMADAEKHLRKAVAHYEKYAAGWVLLGQVLETQEKLEEARDACSKSLKASSSYLPGFLCLTDIATRQENWPDALKFSARALEADPTSNPVSYVFNATANLNLHHLAEAEGGALKALAMDVRNTEPRVHYLLAQIYAAKGDRTQTVAQLHEYLKYANDPADVAVAKKVLAKFETQAQD